MHKGKFTCQDFFFQELDKYTEEGFLVKVLYEESVFCGSLFNSFWKKVYLLTRTFKRVERLKEKKIILQKERTITGYKVECSHATVLILLGYLRFNACIRMHCRRLFIVFSTNKKAFFCRTKLNKQYFFRFVIWRQLHEISRSRYCVSVFSTVELYFAENVNVLCIVLYLGDT